MKRAVDVGKDQGAIVGSEIKAAGIDWVWVNSEPANQWRDQQVRECLDHGIGVGGYSFLYTDWAWQLPQLRQWWDSYRIVDVFLDLEDAAGTTVANVSGATKMLDGWSGKPTQLYWGLAAHENLSSATWTKHPLLLPAYTHNPLNGPPIPPPGGPDTWEAWAMTRPPTGIVGWPWSGWQFTSSATVSGVSTPGHLDAWLLTDAFYSTLDPSGALEPVIRAFVHAPDDPVSGRIFLLEDAWLYDLTKPLYDALAADGVKDLVPAWTWQQISDQLDRQERTLRGAVSILNTHTQDFADLIHAVSVLPTTTQIAAAVVAQLPAGQTVDVNALAAAFVKVLGDGHHALPAVALVAVPQ